MEQVFIELKAFKKDREILLELEDSEGQKGVQTITTKVKPGDEVIWRLTKDSNINKILSVKAKKKSINVFSVLPHQVSDEEFRGTIAKDAGGKKEEYDIVYEYKDGSKVIDDPFLDVIPPDDENGDD